MKSLKSFPVLGPCSDLLSIVNKRILKYSGKSTYPFHPGLRYSTRLCVLVLEIINNDVKHIVIKKGCLLNSFSSWFSFDIMGCVYSDFYGFSPLLFRVYVITWEIEMFWENSIYRTEFPTQSGLLCMQIGKRGWRDFLYSPGEFDFLKYGLASRKECTLKSWWMGGWGMCIYHSPQFKKMHGHGIITVYDHLVLSGICWPHAIWGIRHLWKFILPLGLYLEGWWHL